MKIQELVAWFRARRGLPPARDGAFETFFEPVTETPPANLDRLFMPELMYSDMRLRQHDRADWQNTKIELRTFTGALVYTLTKQGLPFYVHTAYRDALEQARLKAAGRSRALAPFAPHVQGSAVDIVHSSFHWNLTRQEWETIGKIGKDLAARIGIPITWGGDWSFYDPAHWELKDWRATARLNITDGDPQRFTPQRLYKAYPVSQLARS